MFGIEKVEISTTAWHFKWLQFIHWVSITQGYGYNSEGNYVPRTIVTAPKSICPYFWLLMASFVLMLAGLGVIGIVLTLVGVLLYELYLVIISNPIQSSVVLGSIAILIVLVWTIAKYGWIVYDKLFSAMDKYDDRRQTKAPSKTGFIYLVINFAKAKKNKVCPMVDYKF